MSKSLSTIIKKEIQATVGYGFGKNRSIKLAAYIEDGKLMRVEITRQPTEQTPSNTITLETDALEIVRLLVPAMSEFLEEIEKEVGNVR